MEIRSSVLIHSHPKKKRNSNQHKHSQWHLSCAARCKAHMGCNLSKMWMHSIEKEHRKVSLPAPHWQKAPALATKTTGKEVLKQKIALMTSLDSLQFKIYSRKYLLHDHIINNYRLYTFMCKNNIKIGRTISLDLRKNPHCPQIPFFVALKLLTFRHLAAPVRHHGAMKEALKGRGTRKAMVFKRELKYSKECMIQLFVHLKVCNFDMFVQVTWFNGTRTKHWLSACCLLAESQPQTR